MSTMKVTNLKHESSATNNIVLNSDGSVGGELSDALAEKLPYSYGTATPSTTDEGFLWYDENDTPPTPKFWDGAAFQALGGGAVLQVARATRTSSLNIASSSYVDVLNITVTPKKPTSEMYVTATFTVDGFSMSTSDYAQFRIIDGSANQLQGTQRSWFDVNPPGYDYANILGYHVPGSTTAQTYTLQGLRTGSAGYVRLYVGTTVQLVVMEIDS